MDAARDLADAIVLATNAHIGQLRKGAAEPYILHPMRVMLSFSHESNLQRIVGILHDVVEDCEDWPMERFASVWQGDPRVIPAVDAISRRKAQGETHRQYIARVATNDIAVSVKLADLLDNLRDPWWCPRGMAERYTRDYQELHAVATERRLLVPG